MAPAFGWMVESKKTWAVVERTHSGAELSLDEERAGPWGREDEQFRGVARVPKVSL